MLHQFPEETLNVLRKAIESHCREKPEDEELAYPIYKWTLREIDKHRRQRRLFYESEIGHFNHELVEQPGEVRSSPYAEYSRPQ
jgi:DUF1365 family protein